LLLDSIEVTLKHPIFGIGPGQFADHNWHRRKDAGLPTIFNVTHNTYTQISSEVGIPGLIIFLGLLISVFRAIRSVAGLKSSMLYRPPPVVLDAAHYLTLALVVLCVCGFFLALAFGPLFYVTAAIIAVFHRSVQDALPGWRVTPDLSALAPQRRPSAWRPRALAAPGLARSDSGGN